MSTLKTDNIESLYTGRVIEVDSLLDRVIRVTSVAAIEAYSAPVGYVFSLNDGGRSGTFDVVAGDFSTELSDDTGNGVYVGLADNASGTTKIARRRYNKYVLVDWFGAYDPSFDSDPEGDHDVAGICQAALDVFEFIEFGNHQYNIDVTLVKMGRRGIKMQPGTKLRRTVAANNTDPILRVEGTGGFVDFNSGVLNMVGTASPFGVLLVGPDPTSVSSSGLPFTFKNLMNRPVIKAESKTNPSSGTAGIYFFAPADLSPQRATYYNIINNPIVENTDVSIVFGTDCNANIVNDCMLQNSKNSFVDFRCSYANTISGWAERLIEGDNTDTRYVINLLNRVTSGFPNYPIETASSNEINMSWEFSATGSLFNMAGIFTESASSYGSNKISGALLNNFGGGNDRKGTIVDNTRGFYENTAGFVLANTTITTDSVITNRTGKFLGSESVLENTNKDFAKIYVTDPDFGSINRNASFISIRLVSDIPELNNTAVIENKYAMSAASGSITLTSLSTSATGSAVSLSAATDADGVVFSVLGFNNGTGKTIDFFWEIEVLTTGAEKDSIAEIYEKL